MVESQDSIKYKILKFYTDIKDIFPVKTVFLYGSYARGTMNDLSDIDVGVVVDLPENINRAEVTSKLLHYARKIDSNIEPKTIFWNEYLNHDKASILAEIIRTGIKIV